MTSMIEIARKPSREGMLRALSLISMQTPGGYRRESVLRKQHPPTTNGGWRRWFFFAVTPEECQQIFVTSHSLVCNLQQIA
jgi:hypothetical protein